MDGQSSSRLKKSTPATASWSRASTRLGLRFKSSRPTISAPIGPVKTSRGPDFSRSETLTIVSEIKDCAAARQAPLTSNLPIPTKPSRQITTSFSTQSLTSKPTVAKSQVTATTEIHAPLEKVSIKKLLGASNIELPPRPVRAKPRLQKSSTTSLLFDPVTPIQDEQDENIPPECDYSTKPDAVVVPTVDTPKSRTLIVLQDLKTSISRSSHQVRNTSYLTMAPALSSSLESFEMQPSSSNLQLAPTQSSLSPSPSPCDSSQSPAAAPECSQVNNAQPSQFWTGRFVSLHDKLSSENLDYGSLHSLAATYKQGTHNSLSISSHLGAKVHASARPNRIPHSTTTSALPSLAMSFNPRLEGKSEEVQLQRIFQHLESHCTTQEAKASLHSWQHDYARQNRRPDLLPPGYRKDGSRIMGKLFGHHQTGEFNGGRRSISALRDAANSRLGRMPRSAKQTPVAGIGKLKKY